MSSSVCFGSKKNLQTGYLWWRVNVMYLTWAIWLVWQHATCSYILPQFYQWRVQNLFFWQGCRACMKSVVSGDETNYSHACVLEPHAGRGWRFRWGARWGWCSFPRKCTRRAYHWCKWIQLHFSSVTRTLCWLSKPLVCMGVSESVPYVGELLKYLGSLYKFPGTDITQSQYCVYSFGNMELV